jgi:outer membrane protein OmpA-like peptidoglycan-associated protein
MSQPVHASSRLLAEQDVQFKRQLAELQAKITDRGLVVTLEDALFASGSADLKAEAASDLSNLIAFLEEHPARTVVIEGHTDSLGAQGFNHGLSQRRADAVMAYLIARGVETRRVRALGKGESEPVAANHSAAGRRCNRRVEVIIDNPPVALR